MAIKIPFVADVAGFLRGTDDVVGALEDIQGSLDDLGRSRGAESAEEDLEGIGRTADASAEKLERSFSDAFDTLKREGRVATRRVQDDVDDIHTRGGSALRDFRDEAKQNLAESVSSFRGDAESAVDAVQSTFGGLITAFGPLGVAAAAAVGVGIGALRGLFAEAEEKTRAFEERVQKLFEELAEHDQQVTVEFREEGIRELISDGERLQEVFGEANAEKVNANLAKIGLTPEQISSIFGGLVGGFEDVSAALGTVGAAQAKWSAILTDPTASATAQANARQNLANLAQIETALNSSGDAAGDATAKADLLAKAIGEIPTKHATDVNVDDHGSVSRTTAKVNDIPTSKTVKVSVDARGVQEEIARVVGGKVYRFDVAPRPGKAVGL